MATFSRSLDAGKSDEVTPTSVKQDGTLTTEPLEVGVIGPGDANRMLIFSGIARVLVNFGDDDGDIARGPAVVKLNYKLPDTVKFISSSTSAALANIFNATGEFFTFAVESAATEPQLVDPNNAKAGLELVLTANLAVQGEKTGVSAVAYQAHVLVQDTAPELESILVTNLDAINFQPSAKVRSGQPWAFKVTLTGPAVGQGFFLPYRTSDPLTVPLIPGSNSDLSLTIVGVTNTSAVFTAPHVGTVTVEKKVTITASGTKVVKRATITVVPIPPPPK